MEPFLNNRFPQSSLTPPSTASAPPPPSEVKVRTMRSDLASMAKSGGGLPRFENVKVEGFSAEARSTPAAVHAAMPSVPGATNMRNTAAAPGGGAAAESKKSVVTVLIVILVVIALGALGYFGYARYFAGNQGAGDQGNSSAGAATQNASGNGSAGGMAAVPSASPSPLPTAVPSAAPFTHVSLFTKQPADQVLTLTLAAPGTGATSAADLATFSQKLSSLLATAKNTATMVEVDVKNGNGEDMSIGDILTQANAAVLSPAFLAANFSPDATFFAYRDANGFWPGYVLALQSGESPSSLTGGSVAQLESSPNIANLFLNDPGAPSSGGFTDSTVKGVAVRILPFLTANPPAFFIYGWAGNDLIVSTSPGGFQKALEDL